MGNMIQTNVKSFHVSLWLQRSNDNGPVTLHSNFFYSRWLMAAILVPPYPNTFLYLLGAGFVFGTDNQITEQKEVSQMSCHFLVS